MVYFSVLLLEFSEIHLIFKCHYLFTMVQQHMLCGMNKYECIYQSDKIKSSEP